MNERARQHIPSGAKFGVLTFMEEVETFFERGKPVRRGVVRCVCGETKIVRIHSILNRSIKSCGKDECIKENRRREQARIKYESDLLHQMKLSEKAEKENRMKELGKFEFIAISFAKLGQEELMHKAITEMHSETRKALGSKY